MVEHDHKEVKPFLARGEARNPGWRGMADCTPTQNLPLENEVAYGRMVRGLFPQEGYKGFLLLLFS
ncbi:MAG: hypothetical protein ACI9UV_000003 [Algoriphagus sp.]|jgi:hypothetical protein